MIIKTIWNDLASDDKYFLGLTFSKYKNNGNEKLILSFTRALMSVGGFDYVPENLRSLSFIETAKELKIYTMLGITFIMNRMLLAN